MKLFVQADMLSVWGEYKDFKSDKQRGAYPSPPKGRGKCHQSRPICSAGYAYPPEQGGEIRIAMTNEQIIIIHLLCILCAIGGYLIGRNHDR